MVQLRSISSFQHAVRNSNLSSSVSSGVAPLETPQLIPARQGIVPPLGGGSSVALSDDDFRPFIVLDGTNIIRHGVGAPHLQLLLQVVIESALPANDFICFFDAPTFYELRNKRGQRHSEAFEKLLYRYPDHFIECTGGTAADPFIIREADARNATVISNDLFREFHEIFQWTRDYNRFIRIKAVRDVLYIHDRRIAMQGDLDTLMQAFTSVMDLRIGRKA